MTKAARSAAMPETVDALARRHLLRADRQEDLCFALWHPSTGQTRITAVVERLILPKDGERNVHGNASFESHYFTRVLSEAAQAGAGVALMHSHPGGLAWQGMSPDDINTEQGHAAAVYGATKLPFVGFTIASDGAWSARFWERTGPRQYAKRDCATVRVVGERLRPTFMEALAPVPRGTDAQIRTISAWGKKKQADLARLRVGIVGAGSVGAFIAEGMARTGLEDITVIDFDEIETKNLDRLLYAKPGNVGALIRQQARPHHRDAEGTPWHDNCRYHDRNGLAAAFGAWLSCGCRPQETRSQSGFRTDRQRPDLSHQGWKGFVRRCGSRKAGRVTRWY
jgi:hypothetical protein